MGFAQHQSTQNESITATATDQRLAYKLALFDSMPDTAFVDINLVSALLDRSHASVWRDVKAGRLASPFKIGVRSTRWRVGDVRRILEGGE